MVFSLPKHLQGVPPLRIFFSFMIIGPAKTFKWFPPLGVLYVFPLPDVLGIGIRSSTLHVLSLSVMVRDWLLGVLCIGHGGGGGGP